MALNKFRYSVLPGSNNTPILISRQAIAASYASEYNLDTHILRQEQTLITMSLTGNCVFTDSEAGVSTASKSYVGDRLTVVVDTAGHTLSFGEGFANNGSSPEQPVGSGQHTCIEFICNGSLWVATTASAL